jgi:predicted MPP superfamily phosphohydrolase
MTAALVWSALALAALGHGFLWTGLVNRLHGLGWPRGLISGLTKVLVAAFVVLPGLVLWRQLTRPATAFDPFAAGDWAAVYLWICLVVGAVSLLMKPWVESLRYDRSVLLNWTADRRDAAKALGRKPLHGPLGTFLGNLPGNEALTVSVDRKRLAIPRLPAELEGLTIAHISDLHMTGAIGPEYFSYVARQVNDLRPDVIAITGDIIEQERCREWLGASLGQLCAPLGVYFILGNHDAFIDMDATRGALIDAGLTCLSGRWLRADWNGAAVTLGGNELPWLLPAPSLADLPARDVNRPEFRLILCHSPDQFGWCQQADADLALAGHTHGGQVRLPLLGVIASPSVHGTRYACGVFRRGATVMHVTRGIGGETPLRWRCPPEVALLELTGEPA